MGRKGAVPVKTKQAICADAVAGLRVKEIATSAFRRCYDSACIPESPMGWPPSRKAGLYSLHQWEKEQRVVRPAENDDTIETGGVGLSVS